jgi:branched-chain amino acid transport system ATP-binding protein
MMVDAVFQVLGELHEEGVTILLVEQNAARTIQVADRTYVLRSGGRIELEGSSEELLATRDFVGGYIGLRKDPAA